MKGARRYIVIKKIQELIGIEQDLMFEETSGELKSLKLTSLLSSTNFF